MSEAAARKDSVYEVFIRASHEAELTNVGSVVAASADLALLLARENFLRRDPAVALYVVRREHLFGISAAEDPDFFAREFDRSYRQPYGYPENARTWQKYRRKAMTIEELVE